MHKIDSLKDIEAAARSIRRHIISMLAAAGSGHPGGSLSAVEILCALYFRVLRHDPKEPGKAPIPEQAERAVAGLELGDCVRQDW